MKTVRRCGHGIRRKAAGYWKRRQYPTPSAFAWEIQPRRVNQSPVPSPFFGFTRLQMPGGSGSPGHEEDALPFRILGGVHDHGDFSRRKSRKSA